MKLRGGKQLHRFPGVLVKRLAVNKEDAQDPPWSGKRHLNMANSTPNDGKQQRHLQEKPSLQRPALPCAGRHIENGTKRQGRRRG